MKNKILTILMLVGFCAMGFSQNLDSIFTNIRDYKKPDEKNKTWLDTLNKDKFIMRESWLNSSAKPIKLYGESKYADIYYGLSTESELTDCDLLPMEMYLLDSLWKDKLEKNNNMPINDLISLTKDKASFYVIKNQKFYYRVTMKRVNDKWVWSTYGAPYKTMSDTLSKIHFQLKKNLITIYNQSGGNYLVLYAEDNQLINVDSEGQCRTLKSLLLEKIRKK